MDNQKPKVFADGFSFKKGENAPEWVIGRQSIKVDEAIAFLQANNKKGWVNIDIKLSQKGTYYCELDTWEAKPKSEAPVAKPIKSDPSDEVGEINLPF
jgi:hypothetical protein